MIVATTEFVMHFHSGTEPPEGSYREHLAGKIFHLERRSRPFGKGTLEWLAVLDSSDVGLGGEIRQTRGGTITASLRTPTTNPDGTAGCPLVDTYECQGDLAAAGPWILQRTSTRQTCCNGHCDAPGTLVIRRGH